MTDHWVGTTSTENTVVIGQLVTGKEIDNTHTNAKATERNLYALSPVLTIEQDTTAPTVTGAAVSSTAPSSNTYKAGNTITPNVTFSETVNVVGAPTLDLIVGGNTRQATYNSGSGTDTLIFSYTVVSDAAGVSIAGGTAIITLPGGASIKDGSNNDANLNQSQGEKRRELD